ncbi:MAG: hypothetical protein ABFD52_07605 [Acidobacteriota bacterium]
MSKPFIVLIAVIILGSVPLPSSVFGQEIVGPAGREAILERCPAWQDVVAAYQPDPEALDKLRGLAREVRVEVYFGSWCPDSKDHVSAFFKVLDLADTPLLQAVYVGVPEAGDKRAPYVRERKIEKLPTFVVLVDGREAGRIVEAPNKSVEADLVKILGL